MATLTIKHARPDGSFVIEKNGMPYHVTLDDPLHDAVAAQAEGNVYPDEAPAVQIMIPAATVVSNAQARAALIQAGLFDDVQSLIASANDPILTTAWEYANTVDRNGIFVTTLAAQLNMSSQQIDDLFAAAAQIQF